jgi:protein disulfide-isomerase/protein disulfide isomerase family A protein 5
LLCRNGNQKFLYEGENNKNGLVNFMKNPSKPPEKPKEEDWSAVKSDVVHLTSENFDTVITVCILLFFVSHAHFIWV